MFVENGKYNLEGLPEKQVQIYIKRDKKSTSLAFVLLKFHKLPSNNTILHHAQKN